MIPFIPLGIAAAVAMVTWWGYSTVNAGPDSTPADIAAAYGITQTEAAAMCAVAAALGVRPQYLANAIWFESQWKPNAHNPLSDASGLIQIVPSQAKRIGTTTAALRAMPIVVQLPWIQKYFAPHAGKLQSQRDVYMAIYYQPAVGKPDSWVIGSDRGAEYVRTIQANNPGIKTVGDYTNMANKRAKLPVT